MKSKILFSLILLGNLFYFSCKSKAKEEPTEDKPFYPIGAFIKEQLNKLDSMPLAVFKYTYSGDKRDSVIIEKTEARKSAEEFLQPDITDSAVKKSYTESTFMDETINLVTITYTAKDDNAEIRKANVYINPNNDKVKSIYIEKRTVANGQNVSKIILWKADQNFEIVTSAPRAGMADSTSRIKYVWDGE